MSAPDVVRTTVLVADDDALIRSALRVALSRMGYSVIDAGDAVSVIALAADAHPSLVILDLNMPGGTAHGTLSALRDLNPRVAVLMLSGEAHAPSDIVGPLTDFARKPIEHTDLVARVERLLAEQSES